MKNKEVILNLIESMDSRYYKVPSHVQMVLSDVYQIYLPLFEVKSLINEINTKKVGTK